MAIRPILAPYISIAQMLVETFGKDCEVVLHDLRDPQHSVVYVANNQVTGRREGQSFDQLVKQVIFSKELKKDYVSNYYFIADNSKLIRSSTLLIHDLDGVLEGALCINLDTSQITAHIEFLKSFLPQACTIPATENSETPELSDDDLHVTQMITVLIDNILRDCEPKSMCREDKLQKIRFMDERGIFLMKGSIEQVAEKMGISKVTVYSYLDVVRGKHG